MNSNIFTKAYGTVFTTISGISPFVSNGSRWIFGAYPQTEGSIIFPIVTIEPFTTEQNNGTYGLNRVKGTISTTIEVHDNFAGSRFDILCGSVLSKLTSSRGTFANSGLYNLSIGPTTYDTTEITARNRIHTKAFGVTFDYDSS